MLILPWRMLLLGGLLLMYIMRGQRLLRYPLAQRQQIGIIRTTRYARRALRVLGLQLRIDHDGQPCSDRGGLSVSNHLGYLDVLLLSARRPTVFVTSKEIEATPVLGDICTMAGSLFVERRSRRAAHADSEMLAASLRRHPVHLFPEGTSSNGLQVLPFRSALLASAQQAAVAVHPCCLRYERVAGRPFGPANADGVCWYGDMSFAPHFIQLLWRAPMSARIVVMPSVPSSALTKRKVVSAQLESDIRRLYMQRS